MVLKIVDETVAAESERLRQEVSELNARLREASQVIAGYNSQPTGPRTAFVLGWTLAGGDPAKAEAAMPWGKT